MRTWIALILALLLMAGACSSDNNEAATDATPAEPTAAPTAEPTVAPTEVPTAAPAPTATAEPDPTATAEPAPEPEPTPAPDADEFDYLETGDYDVGVTTVVIDEDTDRPLTVDVWFPIEEPAADAALHQYTFLPGVYYESPDAVSASLDTAAAGPFPLVIYSHGSGGQRYIHADYTEFIASHGYVVLAPDHTGNTLLERFSGAAIDLEQIALARPTDISSVIDAALGLTISDLGPALDGLLTDQVAVTGHSFGGFTSYAMASGVATDDVSVEPDERVDAIITLAPAASSLLLPDERLSAIDIPHMVIVGDSDDTTPATPNADRPFELIVGQPNYRVDLADGEHETFTDLCAYVDFLPQLGNVPPFITDALDGFAASACGAEAMPLERAQEITNSMAILFLDEVLNGGSPIDATLNYGDDVIVQADTE